MLTDDAWAARRDGFMKLIVYEDQGHQRRGVNRGLRLTEMTALAGGLRRSTRTDR
jgi:hypothetical protein